MVRFVLGAVAVGLTVTAVAELAFAMRVIATAWRMRRSDRYAARAGVVVALVTLVATALTIAALVAVRGGE